MSKKKQPRPGWISLMRSDHREMIRDCLSENRRAKEDMWVGVTVKIGPRCSDPRGYDGAFMPIELARAHIVDWLPPYRGSCDEATCRCEVEPYMSCFKLEDHQRIVNDDGTVSTLAEIRELRKQDGHGANEHFALGCLVLIVIAFFALLFMLI